MKRPILHCALVCCLLLLATVAHSQLQEPSPPVNLIIDSGMAIDVDDVGAHAVLWGMADRGEVNVLALICSSANDYSCPTMRAIANYYNHPNVPIGAHMGSTPNTGGSNTSVYTQQITNQFGTPGDTRANYPDAVTVYRQALAGAADNSVYILADGYYQPLQGLLQSQPDAISPLTGTQLVAQKVRRLVSNGGWFPSGAEGNFENDTDAASYVFVNWPGEIVSVGANATSNVLTGPSQSSDPTQDPVAAAYNLYANSTGTSATAEHAFGQIPLIYAVRGGIGTNFTIGGFNGQTTIDDTTDQFRGENFWSSTPQVGQSYLDLAITTDQMAAIINPLLQSSSTMPILRSISPTSVSAGSSGQIITLAGTNFFSDSQVTVNGASRTAAFVSATQLTVQLTSGDLSSAGTLALGVANTEGLGWTSNTINLNVTGTTATVPTLSAISPVSVVAGSGATTITATGTNFVSGSAIQVNGSNLTTAFVSSTQLSATIPATATASAGTLSVDVTTPGAGTSGSLVFTVNNPSPSLSGVSPSNVAAGSGAFTLTVNGSGFVNGSVVQVNGSSRATTFVSATQLTAAIPASDIASAGTIIVTVFNPAPGGGTTSGATLSITNPQPSLTSMTPTSVNAGSPAFTLTLNGANFISGSIVQVNGSNRTTTFVSSSQLTAQISSADVATGANLSINVVNPSPGGGTSGALTLAVLNPAPAISSISPSTTLVLGSSFTLTVNGSGFVNGSVVQVNGSPRTTKFVSSTQLTAQIENNDILSVGTRNITVFNPAPGGGTSNSATLTVIGLLGQSAEPNAAPSFTATLAALPEPFFTAAV